MANSGPHSPVQRTDPEPNYVSKIKVKQNLLLVYIYFSVWLEIIFFLKYKFVHGVDNKVFCLFTS